MQKHNADLLPAPSESGDVSCDKIHQQQTPDDVASRKPRNSQVCAGESKEEEEAFKISILRLVNADVNLVDRSEENQDHGACQAENG